MKQREKKDHESEKYRANNEERKEKENGYCMRGFTKGKHNYRFKLNSSVFPLQ